MKKLAWAALLAASLPLMHGCAAVVVGGAATAVVVADDRRTAGTVVEDQEIELRAMNRLREGFPQKTVSVSTVSYNRQVLLVGQVPDEATRAKVVDTVRAIPGVIGVHNEITISGVTSLTSKTNDASITTKVKARLLNTNAVQSNHVKVVTEAAVVYLMGLVRKDEGEAAGKVAAGTAGVSRVVKLFEYID
ncbi:BON domain-containing protein [Betaproteobacteria bacterium SCN2]|nr:BON domain-containing protein [Betaproteobacteria bacterium SCN2]